MTTKRLEVDASWQADLERRASEHVCRSEEAKFARVRKNRELRVLAACMLTPKASVAVIASESGIDESRLPEILNSLVERGFLKVRVDENPKAQPLTARPWRRPGFWFCVAIPAFCVLIVLARMFRP
jgi:transcriptional regulator TrmB